MIPEQCVILVDGYGAEAGDATPGPTSLRPGDPPVLETLVGEAVRFGFKRILLLGGSGETMRTSALDRRMPADVELRILEDPAPRDAAGALKRALSHLDERVLLLDGVAWFDFNWLDLARQDHAGADWDAILTLRLRPETHGCAVATTRGDQVTGFGPGAGGPGLVDAGVSVLRRAFVAGFPDDASLDRDLLPAAAARGRLRFLRQDSPVPRLDTAGDRPHTRTTAVLARVRRPAAFLDRDGVLNVDIGYAHRLEDMVFVPGAERAVRRLNRAGYYVFVVTNQAGVARGLYPEAAIAVFHADMQRRLRLQGAHIDDWRYCAYHPEGTLAPYARPHPWRKPAPGMILDLMDHWPVAAAGSFLIGDKTSDLAAAAAAGLPGRLFEGPDLDRAVAGVLDEIGRRRPDPI